MSILQELEAAMNRLPHMLKYAEAAIPCYVSDDSITECFTTANDVYCCIRYISEVVGNGYQDGKSRIWKYAVPVHMVNKIMLRTIDFAMKQTWNHDHRSLNHWQRDAIEIIDLIEGLD